ncbi:hypothetical protein PHLCEN_2v302 [Hermanssonia centrifuga]|uniref:Uncharacterized protein n=1 Tax=Hermanssonia centrifuga TaxID=98765 RepID=A0A2R6S6B6_9APHY|nr:hypothetical protein PHLCEN_2v302 [Hermanssonia centrifuga]
MVEELGQIDSFGELVGFACALDELNDFFVECQFALGDLVCREVVSERVA